MKFYDSKEVNTSTQRLETQRTESIGGNISSRKYFEDKNFFEVLEIVVDSVARATFIVSRFITVCRRSKTYRGNIIVLYWTRKRRFHFAGSPVHLHCNSAKSSWNSSRQTR